MFFKKIYKKKRQRKKGKIQCTISTRALNKKGPGLKEPNPTSHLSAEERSHATVTTPGFTAGSNDWEWVGLIKVSTDSNDSRTIFQKAKRQRRAPISTPRHHCSSCLIPNAYHWHYPPFSGSQNICLLFYFSFFFNLRNQKLKQIKLRF